MIEFFNLIIQQLGGILVGVIATILGAVLISKYSIDMKIVNFLSRNSTLYELKEIINKNFIKFPALGPTLYYKNDLNSKSPQKNPFFMFFSQEGKQIQEFKAFMIPSLDNGHIEKKNEQKLSAALDDQWSLYLINLGDKIRRNLIENPKIEPGKRIVFLEQNVLNTFLQDPDRIIKDSKIATNGSLEILEYSERDNFQKFGLSIINKVIQTIYLHKINMDYLDSINCFYIDKRVVKSNQYYDFGYYKIDGISVIFTPAYLMDNVKTIVQDKVHIGETRLQKSKIKDFEEDFNSLWEHYKMCRTKQKQLMINENPDDFFENLSSEYYKEIYFTAEYFNQGYFQLLKKVLKTKLGYKF